MADRIANVQTEEDIRSLDFPDNVRTMPGMYVGGHDEHALHHLVYEVVDNSIDEIMSGRGDHVWILIRKDGYISVIDNCGGIPVGMHKQQGISTLTLVLTRLHAGAKFNDGTTKVAYKVSGGLHGVGVSAVNALSSHFIAEVRRDGKVWKQEFECGRATTAVEPVRDMEEGEPTGTTISFHPDLTIIDTGDFKAATLLQRFREMAYVTRGATITLIDERETPFPNEMTFYFEGGVKSFVRYLNRNRETVHDVVGGIKDVKFNEGQTNEGWMSVEFGFQYTEGTSSSTELSFANHINTPDGGSHQTGIRVALTRVINNYARKQGILKEKDTNFAGRDTLEGLTAIVSIKHPSPQFEAQTKSKLINPEVQSVVAAAVSDIFAQYLEENPREARRIVDKCMNSMRIRDALDKQRELLTGRKNLLENTTLPGKLADCSERDANRTELYLVEGDSAGGCIVGDTQISLTTGISKPIEELARDWQHGITYFGYATDAVGEIQVVPLVEPRLTKRNANLVEVLLDNGQTIRCTPDHPFRVHDGSYRPASELQPNERLMSMSSLGMSEAVLVLPGGYSASDTQTVDAHTVLQMAEHSDYKVVSVTSINETADVYDLTVDRYHNFALASGVFVHNSAKQGRDRHFQAILPLRGKILNTERARLNKILDSTEIRALISALGVGISDDFNVSKLRYNRIIIMTDADVDGAHIRTLLLTFFFRYMQPLIQDGHLYIAQPPIFRLEYRKQAKYIYPEAGMKEDAILNRALATYAEPTKVTVSRYKGLGEMNPQQLWETTMDPVHRTLLRVTIDDGAEADRIFDMLMGNQVPPRRKFIQTHARNARLDV